jgi:indole-3-glycerol phosphate synthase
VLTDGPHFGGRLEDLDEARSAAPLPALRKDFIVLPYQVYEARAAGADAVLLIAAMLSDEEMRSLHALAGELGMAALVEVHSKKEMERASRVSPRIIGINSRDLGTMKVDLATFETLAPLAPRGAILVAESGIRSRGDAERVERAGARAVLVGETLMRSADAAAKVRELLGR